MQGTLQPFPGDDVETSSLVRLTIDVWLANKYSQPAFTGQKMTRPSPYMRVASSAAIWKVSISRCTSPRESWHNPQSSANAHFNLECHQSITQVANIVLAATGGTTHPSGVLSSTLTRKCSMDTNYTKHHPRMPTHVLIRR